MAARHYKKQQYGIGNLDRIALMIFAGAALAGWQVLTSNISQFLIVAVFIFFLAAIFGLLMLWYVHNREQQRIRALAIAEVDRMEGPEFEQYVGQLLTHQGYQVSYTKTSGDYANLATTSFTHTCHIDGKPRS